MANIVTKNFRQLCLAAYTASVNAGDFDGPLTGMKVGLYTNEVALGAGTVLADLTEPTPLTGYAKKDIVWGSPYQEEDGSISVQGGLLQFQGDGTNSHNIQGYFVQTGEGTPKLAWAETFENGPLPLSDLLNAIIITPQFGVGGPDDGQATVLSS